MITSSSSLRSQTSSRDAVHVFGDSLVCGVQGYDFLPQDAFFSLISAACGRPLDFPKLRWNLDDFLEAITWPEDSRRLTRVLETLSAADLRLSVSGSPLSDGIYAAPGFTLNAFLRYRESTGHLPPHLAMLARPFVHPDGEQGGTLFERALAAPSPRACIVWLGNVEWINCLLSARRRPERLARALLRQYATVMRHFVAAHGSRGTRLVVGSVIDPTTLPLMSLQPDGELAVSFLPEGAAPRPCERLSFQQAQDLRAGVEHFNARLRAMTEDVGGLFVDIGGRYAELRRRGHLDIGRSRIPTADITGADLVHPTLTGHALVAEWFLETLRADLGETGPPIEVEGIWRRERAAYRPVHDDAWRKLLKVIYQRFLYGVGAPRQPQPQARAG